MSDQPIGPDEDATPVVTPVPPELTRGVWWTSVAAVWALAVVCAVVVAVVGDPDTYAGALGIALGACMIATLGFQVMTRQKHGILDRMSLSISGALAVLVVAAGILSLVALATT